MRPHDRAGRKGPLPGPALAAVLLLLLVGAASAAVVARHESTLHVGVRDPPVTFEAGDAATKARHVTDFVLTANRTGFTATVDARAGADLNVRDVARILNNDSVARTVTFLGQPVTDPYVTSFTWTIRDGALVVAVFDHRAASPAATFTLPAGAKYALDVRVDSAEGAGRNNARTPFGLSVEVS